MPEAISTQNLVTLPITSQELGGGGLFCPPTKIGLSNSPTTIGLIELLRNFNNHGDGDCPSLPVESLT